MALTWRTSRLNAQVASAIVAAPFRRECEMDESLDCLQLRDGTEAEGELP